jgi:hypothetical protein
MNASALIREINRTDRTIRRAQEHIAAYQVPEPYCYLLPVIGFFIGYKAQAKVNTSTMLQLVKVQLMLNTLLETHEGIHS